MEYYFLVHILLQEFCLQPLCPQNLLGLGYHPHPEHEVIRKLIVLWKGEVCIIIWNKQTEITEETCLPSADSTLFHTFQVPTTGKGHLLSRENEDETKKRLGYNPQPNLFFSCIFKISSRNPVDNKFLTTSYRSMQKSLQEEDLVHQITLYIFKL